MRKSALLIAGVLMLGASCIGSAEEGSATAEKEKKAKSAASAWLGLIDKGRYAESWETAASFFKERVEKEQWEKQIKMVREPLGKVLKREVEKTTFTRELPGVPDGEYVLILYDTSFERKEKAQERVTPMFDKDGTWRVSGYYIY